MFVFSFERNKPFKCKTIFLFCPPDWELTEVGLFRVSSTLGHQGNIIGIKFIFVFAAFSVCSMFCA